MADAAPEQELPGSAIADLPDVLIAALEQTRSATCITTADLDQPGPQIVYVNPAYCRMTGRTRREVIGRTPRLMQGPLTDRAVLDRLRADLGAGRSFTGETVNYRADGAPFIINWSIDAVRDAAGTATHFVATQQDVTAEVRARALLTAGRRLDDALTSVLDSSVRAADGLQHLADEIAAGAGAIAGMGHVAVVLVDDDEGRTIGAGDETREAGSPLSEEYEVAMRGFPARGRVTVGGLTEAEHTFLDREGLSEYAERAGMVCAALLEYLQQRSTALRLQHSLLPRTELLVPDFSIATYYEPGALGLEVGGDWYDATTHGDRAVFSVGDVSGSGVDAATLMGRLRLLAEVELNRGLEPPEVLALLDAECRKAGDMATIVIVDAAASNDSATMWSAGHLPPVVIRGDGVRLAEIDVAPPLGFMTTPPAPTTIGLGPGDAMLLYTDGLVERRNEIVTDGLDRLVAALERGSGVDDLVRQAIASAGASAEDDLAILAFRRS